MARELSIDAIKSNLTDPLRTYLWEMMIPNVPGGGDVDAVRLRCVSSAIPNVASEEIVVDWRAMRFRIAGKLNYSHTITMTFLESADRKILDAFYNWRKLVTNPETGAGVAPSEYKTDIYISLLNTKGEEVVKIKLMGCYPQEMGEIALDMATNEIIRPTVTFSYDRWVFEE